MVFGRCVFDIGQLVITDRVLLLVRVARAFGRRSQKYPLLSVPEHAPREVVEVVWMRVVSLLESPRAVTFRGPMGVWHQCRNQKAERVSPDINYGINCLIIFVSLRMASQSGLV